MPLRDILSQELALSVLTRAWARDKLHHGWIFTGPSGVGKTMLAREMARLLVCENPTDEPDACGECRSCRMLDASGHPDVLVVEMPEGKTRISVEQVAEVRRRLAYPPWGGRGRAVVFEKADLMNAQAQNALLKTLEEPSQRTYLLLTTSKPGGLLTTIHSRCSTLELRSLPVETLEQLVAQQRPETEEVTRKLAARLSSGSVTTAVELCDMGLDGLSGEVMAIDDALAHGDVPKLLGEAEELSGTRERLLAALDLLALWYRDVMRVAALGAEDDVAFAHERARLVERAASLGVRGSSERVAAVLETKEGIVWRNANARLALEDLFLRMLS